MLLFERFKIRGIRNGSRSFGPCQMLQLQLFYQVIEKRLTPRSLFPDREEADLTFFMISFKNVKLEWMRTPSQEGGGAPFPDRLTFQMISPRKVKLHTHSLILDSRRTQKVNSKCEIGGFEITIPGSGAVFSRIPLLWPFASKCKVNSNVRLRPLELIPSSIWIDSDRIEPKGINSTSRIQTFELTFEWREREKRCRLPYTGCRHQLFLYFSRS